MSRISGRDGTTPSLPGGRWARPADVLPDQKAEAVRKLPEVRALAADSVNDVPALAQAHVTAAMSLGSVSVIGNSLRGWGDLEI